MDQSNFCHEHAVQRTPHALRPHSPGVILRRRLGEGVAHEPDGVAAAVVANGPIIHRDTFVRKTPPYVVNNPAPWLPALTPVSRARVLRGTQEPMGGAVDRDQPVLGALAVQYLVPNSPFPYPIHVPTEPPPS